MGSIWVTSARHRALSGLAGDQRSRIRSVWTLPANKELLYTHLQAVDTAAMQATIAVAESTRATLQTRLHGDAAIAVSDADVVLEDETIDDNEMDRVVLQEDDVHEEAAISRPVVQVIDTDAQGEDIVQVAAPPELEEYESSSCASEPQPPAPPVPAPTPVPPPEAKPTPTPEPAAPPPPRDDATMSGMYTETTVPLSEAPSSRPPPEPAAGDDADGVERQALLRQLDLLRVKFRQSIIPDNIEAQATAAVRTVVERNLLNLKRAQPRGRHGCGGPASPQYGHVQAGPGGVPRRPGVPTGPPHAAGHVAVPCIPTLHFPCRE